jgi:hypothetical protein
MRSHPAAGATVDTIMDILEGEDAQAEPLDAAAAAAAAAPAAAAAANGADAWSASLHPNLIALAANGLGVIVADAAPRHPFHRDAGVTVAGVYKQKLFATVYARYQRMLEAARTPAAPAAGVLAGNGGGNGGNGGAHGEAATGGPLASPPLGARSHTPEPPAPVKGPTVALLLSLCSIATHLPQPVLLGDVDRVLPIVVRALELTVPAGPRGHAIAPAYGELRDAVAVSALLCLRTIITHAPASVATHLHSLVPVLVRLSRHDTGTSSRPLARCAAIDCLRGFTALPYHRLHPVRAAVVAGLINALDDPRRAVRRRAAAARSDWITLSNS